MTATEKQHTHTPNSARAIRHVAIITADLVNLKVNFTNFIDYDWLRIEGFYLTTKRARKRKG